jgi:serine/threonine-protein kinase Chk1
MVTVPHQKSLKFHVLCYPSRCFRVFRAVHFQEHRVAACKVVTLTPETKPYDRKMIEKEMQVHSALKHANVLEFINAVVVEANGKSRYHPGIYMLLELAAGGDLFDKIGILPPYTSATPN